MEYRMEFKLKYFLQQLILQRPINYVIVLSVKMVHGSTGNLHLLVQLESTSEIREICERTELYMKYSEEN